MKHWGRKGSRRSSYRESEMQDTPPCQSLKLYYRIAYWESALTIRGRYLFDSSCVRKMWMLCTSRAATKQSIAGAVERHRDLQESHSGRLERFCKPPALLTSVRIRPPAPMWRSTQCWQRGRFAKPLGRSNMASGVGTHLLRHYESVTQLVEFYSVKGYAIEFP